MRVAQGRVVLRRIVNQTSRRQRIAAGAVGALAIAALVVAFESGSVAGVGPLIAVLAAGVATALWLRLREVERAHAVLARSVAELTARLDQPTGSLAGPLAVLTPLEETTEVAGDGAAVDPVPTLGDGMTPATEDDAAVPGAQVGPGAAAPSAIEPAGEEASAAPIDDEAPAAVVASVTDTQGACVADAQVALPTVMPTFTLGSLKGATVTERDLAGSAAVAVFWRPGCPHCQRLTPELAAWESLQGPRLIVFAACDGPTAFRAGLPGLVILDPGFHVGQALGAPGTPAALALDATGQPAGPLVAGAAAVTTLLLDAMREWASVEPEPATVVSVMELAAGGSADGAASSEPVDPVQDRPAILLHRVDAVPADERVADAPDWDADVVTRRTG